MHLLSLKMDINGLLRGEIHFTFYPRTWFSLKEDVYFDSNDDAMPYVQCV